MKRISEVRRYEAESGKTLDDEILLGVVIAGLQDNTMRDHLIRNSRQLNSYHLVRSELLEIARTSRVLNQMPQPMEIGATPKGKGKGKDKGKNPKGNGKSPDSKGASSSSQRKGKGKGSGTNKKENLNKDKECHYCHRKGHIKSECKVKQKDDREKDKKSSKYRSAAAAPEDEPQGEPLSATLDQSDLDSFVACAID